MEVVIRSEHGHYVAYLNAKYFCSGDTYLECLQTLAAKGIDVSE